MRSCFSLSSFHGNMRVNLLVQSGFDKTLMKEAFVGSQETFGLNRYLLQARRSR